MDRREKPKPTKEEIAFFAGFDMARKYPHRHDAVGMWREYLDENSDDCDHAGRVRQRTAKTSRGPII